MRVTLNKVSEDNTYFPVLSALALWLISGCFKGIAARAVTRNKQQNCTRQGGIMINLSAGIVYRHPAIIQIEQ